MKRALDATGYVREYATGDEAVDLVVADRGGGRGATALPAYRLEFLTSGTNYVRGPVWAEPGERILEGVSLDGMAYALADAEPEGVAVATVARRPLVAVGTNVCTVAFSNPRLAFFRSPAFPALVQNVAAAASEVVRGGAKKVQEEESSDVLDAGESDLTRCGSGSFGAPAATPENVLRTSSAAWIPALAAIAALLLHFYLYRKKAALVAAAFAVLAMARPVFPMKERCGTLVVVADRSLSMGDAALKEQEKIIRSLASKRPAAAELAVISFGRGAAVEQQPSKEGFEGFIQTIGRDGSDLPGALAKAEALGRDGARHSRVLVMSDGLTDNDGEAACVRDGVDLRARDVHQQLRPRMRHERGGARGDGVPRRAYAARVPRPCGEARHQTLHARRLAVGGRSVSREQPRDVRGGDARRASAPLAL